MFQRQQGLGQLENPSLIANMPLDASASSGISSTAGMPVSNNSQGMQVEVILLFQSPNMKRERLLKHLVLIDIILLRV